MSVSGFTWVWKCCPDTLGENAVEQCCKGLRNLLMMCCCCYGTRLAVPKQSHIADTVETQTPSNLITKPMSSVGHMHPTTNIFNNSSDKISIYIENLYINLKEQPNSQSLMISAPVPDQTSPPTIGFLDQTPPPSSLPSDSVQPEPIRDIISRLDPSSRLCMAHSQSSQYWTFRVDKDDPRFPETAELLKVWWLDITTKIKLADLSRSTTYVAYLIFKINPKISKGLNKLQHAKVATRNSNVEKVVCVNPTRKMSSEVGRPVERSDGWMELELGQFHCDDDPGDQVVEVGFEDKDTNYVKCGLIVAGIEVRRIQAA